MLEPIVAFFDKLIENFSWRRLSFLLSILALAVVALWVYESYTSSFRLARMERQIALLEKLAVVGAMPTVGSQLYLRQSNLNLQSQLAISTSTTDVEYELLPWGKKVLAAAAAWLVFALLILLIPSSYSSTNAGPGSTFMGLVVVAAPFVALAAAIPTFESAWVNYLAYPVGHIVLLVVVILWWQRRARRRLVAAIESLATSRSTPSANT